MRAGRDWLGVGESVRGVNFHSGRVAVLWMGAVRHYGGTTADTPPRGKSDFRGEMAGKYRAVVYLLPNRPQLLGMYTRI